MSMRCRIGWHDWRPFEILPVPEPRNPRKLLGSYYPDCRECQRCGLTQKHAVGLHQPPYWKPVRSSDGRRHDFSDEQLRMRKILGSA